MPQYTEGNMFVHVLYIFCLCDHGQIESCKFSFFSFLTECTQEAVMLGTLSKESKEKNETRDSLQ